MSVRVRAKPWGLPRAGAASKLHSSVLQQSTGRVSPMPSTSEGTHLLAQDLVTVTSPRKGYTVGMGTSVRLARRSWPHTWCRTRCGVPPQSQSPHDPGPPSHQHRLSACYVPGPLVTCTGVPPWGARVGQGRQLYPGDCSPPSACGPVSRE